METSKGAGSKPDFSPPAWLGKQKSSITIRVFQDSWLHPEDFGKVSWWKLEYFYDFFFLLRW